MLRIKSNRHPLATEVNLFTVQRCGLLESLRRLNLTFWWGVFKVPLLFKKDPIKNFFITFQGPDGGRSSCGHHSSLHCLSLFQVCGECLRGSPHILK